MDGERVIGVVISGKRVARAKELAEAGFVHVTGLPVDGEGNKPIQAPREYYNKCDSNNGKLVLVTEEGEVWLGCGGPVQATLCQKHTTDKGAFVPCSNGGTINLHLMLQRIADPYSDCNGRHSPLPSPTA